jgi:hypothetical protein
MPQSPAWLTVTPLFAAFSLGRMRQPLFRGTAEVVAMHIHGGPPTRRNRFPIQSLPTIISTTAPPAGIWASR